MLLKYKEQSNRAVVVAVVAGICLLAVGKLSNGDIFGFRGFIGGALTGLLVAAIWFALWTHAQAKGYSGKIGILFPFIALTLEDKYPDGVTLVDKSPSGVAADFPAKKLQSTPRPSLAEVIEQEMLKEEKQKSKTRQ